MSSAKTAIAVAKMKASTMAVWIFGAAAGFRESALMEAAPMRAMTSDGPRVARIRIRARVCMVPISDINSRPRLISDIGHRLTRSGVECKEERDLRRERGLWLNARGHGRWKGSGWNWMCAVTVGETVGRLGTLARGLLGQLELELPLPHQEKREAHETQQSQDHKNQPPRRQD